jgi:hypothetical protein
MVRQARHLAHLEDMKNEYKMVLRKSDHVEDPGINWHLILILKLILNKMDRVVVATFTELRI